MTLNQSIIGQITLSKDAGIVEFPNISQQYTDLRVVASMRSTNGTLYDYPELYVNSDWETAATDYQMKDLRLANVSIISGGFNSYWAFNIYGSIGDSATANIYSNTEYYIPNYTSTASHKIISCDSVGENASSSSNYMGLNVGVRKSNEAVSRLVFVPALGNFKAGTSFTLYGVTKFGVTPTQTPKATGGDIISNDGTYWYHAFLSSGSFIPQTSINADLLIVGGGGAGGYFGGGGGAGGNVSLFSSILLTPSSYSALVGAGASAVSSGSGGAGTTSYLGSYASLGGLGGSSGGLGSGGVANYPAGSGGRGGYGTSNPPISGSSGTNMYSSFAIATSTGANSGYYSGGGGGGGWDLAGASGGLGGGGQGGLSRPGSVGDNASPGITNTGGGGGGGAAASGNTPLSGAGGSGIVIIKYLMV